MGSTTVGLVIVEVVCLGDHVGVANVEDDLGGEEVSMRGCLSAKVEVKKTWKKRTYSWFIL